MAVVLLVMLYHWTLLTLSASSNDTWHQEDPARIKKSSPVSLKDMIVESTKLSTTLGSPLTTKSDVMSVSSRVTTYSIPVTSEVPESLMSTTADNGTAFLEHLNLSLSDLKQCFKDRASLDFSALSGDFFLELDAHSLDTNICDFSRQCPCNINIKGPEGHIFLVEVVDTREKCSQTISLWVGDTNPQYMYHVYFLDVRTCVMDMETFHSKGNDIIVYFYISELRLPFLLHLRFKAIPKSEDHLSLHYDSPLAGYIQTSRWDGKVWSYFEHVKSQLKLDIPDGHQVMLSFRDFDIPLKTFLECAVTLELFMRSEDYGADLDMTDKETDSDVRLDRCGVYHFRPVLYDAIVLMVYFDYHQQSEVYERYRGFRLRFSFHNQSVLPLKFSDGFWNCSVAHWPAFRQHLQCNLQVDCAEAEDERECSYTDEACGVGHLSVNGLCYTYFSSLPGQTKLDWIQAKAFCERRGARLAAFKTAEAKRQLLKLIRSLLDRTVPLFLGFETTNSNLPEMYWNTVQHVDKTIAYFGAQFWEATFRPICWSLLTQDLKATECRSSAIYIGEAQFLCEFDPDDAKHNSSPTSPDVIHFPDPPSIWPSDVINTSCPEGFLTRRFLSCDRLSACWARGVGIEAFCEAPFALLPPVFWCKNGLQGVLYAMVCDTFEDCGDKSDESFCVFPTCKGGEFDCGNGQCLSWTTFCDGIIQCFTRLDEITCENYFKFPGSEDASIVRSASEPPAIVNFIRHDAVGIMCTVTSLNPSLLNLTSPCPASHFQCPKNGYCLPVYLRCNGVNDCPGREDEAMCISHTCRGFYRCRNSRVCLRPEHFCDSIMQCPDREDELFCDLVCPVQCTCYGTSFYCRQAFAVDDHRDLRFLDVRGTGMTPTSVANITFLVHLGLAQCNLTMFEVPDLIHLHSLDISDNRITTLTAQSLEKLIHLRFLTLARNPLASFLNRTSRISVLGSLYSLDLSRVSMDVLSVSSMIDMPYLHFLNLSYSGIQQVLEPGFRPLKNLRLLDLRGCPMLHFPRDIFLDLRNLHVMYFDNYKLCCPAVLPKGFNPLDCHSPANEISSCNDLLRSVMYRICLCVFAALCLVGNLASIVGRFVKGSVKLGFDVFVNNLCLADFLMGVYLAIIGVVDRMYKGRYLGQDLAWRHSVSCELAGCLSLLSYESSAFIICLITIDRFLVLRLPFSRLRFSPRSALWACCVVWLVSLGLAVVPLLPISSHWQFYSQTSICIPLPVTGKDFPGHHYSFSVIVVLNFFLFLLIAGGQSAILYSVHTTKMDYGKSNSSSNDSTIARRLITIAMSDFMCWFPIGLLALLASQGLFVSGEVNVALAIFALPVNSVVNPFLYTLNMLMERNRKQREQRLQKYLLSQIVSKDSSARLNQRP